MIRISAGLLMYRIADGHVEVLLVHPGGPIWSRRHAGAWFVPKGQLNADEDALTAARREFEEETGVEATGPFFPLGEVKHKSGKRVIAWAVEGSWDTSQLRSNTFSLEWPPRSGTFQEFPEIDKAAFLGLPEARLRIHEAESAFIDRLLAGISVAAVGAGGLTMANANRPGGTTKSDNVADAHRPVRTPNDRVQERERRGVTPERKNGHDEDAEDVDPDSASSDVDRDDTVDK